MANVSDFFGTMILESETTPWTPEGLFALYDHLEAFSGCGGSYGVCVDETFTTDAATFVAELMKDPNWMHLPFWGNGRWSAANTLESFSNWTKNPAPSYWIDSPSTTKKHLENQRKILLDLMYKNQWSIIFEYKDCEGGIGYINEEEARIVSDGTDFITTVHTLDSHNYNLYNYSVVIEEDREGEMFGDVVNSLRKRLDVPDSKQRTFEIFIMNNDYDSQLMPYTFYDETYTDKQKNITEYCYDIPDGLEKHWYEYIKENNL